MTPTNLHRRPPIKLSHMWMHVLPPVMFVVIFWAVTSIGTNIYLQSRDEHYHRLISKNVSLVQAGNEIQIAIWQLLGTWQDPSRHRENAEKTVDPLKKLQQAVTRVHEVGGPSGDGGTTVRLERQWQEFVKQLGDVPGGSGALSVVDLNRLLLPMLEAAQELVVFEQRVLQEANAAQRRMQHRLLAIRSLALILGPVLGIVLGWRLTRRLQQRFAVLAITLRQGTDSNEFELENVTVPDGADLIQVQRLAESIRERVSQLDRELQSARNEAIKAERLAAVGELAAGVAHELRNPLTSVKLLLQLAARQELDVSLSKEKADLILGEIGRMESTIQGLLDFSRPAQMRCARFDLRIPIQRAVNLVEGRMSQRSVTRSIDLTEFPVWIDGDSSQMHQVIVNLLINSIDAMPMGGKLSVKLQPEPSKNTVTLSVQDDGEGITETMLMRMFEPFATTKERGTGLGLAVTHRIVSQHGGKIHAENARDQGAIFYVVLPLAEVSSTAELLNVN